MKNLLFPIGTQKRSGYVLLISVIVIGSVASAILVSVLMLGISAAQVSSSVHLSSQALAIAHACAEDALMDLRTSLSYAGSETQSFSLGTCETLSLGGIGNNSRLICTEGTVGDTTRRIEIVVEQVLPEMKISSWQEVGAFTLCST